jgi:cyanate permease
MASLLGFAIWSPMFCVPPMQHIIKEELSLTYAQTSLIFTAPLLMVVALAIPGGIIADRIGARRAAGIGIIIVAVGAMLRSVATDAPSLLAFTFIYGIGAGLSFPNLPKLVSGWVPREKAGVATGIFSSGLVGGPALALAITMPIVFPITNTTQGVFFIWGITPVITAILWWLLAKDPPGNSLSDETTTRTSTSYRRVLRDKHLWLIAAIFLLHNIFFYTWAGWMPTFIRMKGATPELAGLITSIFLWVAIPTLFLMPRLAYRLGVRRPFVLVPAIVLALAALGIIYANIAVSWPIMVIVGIANVTRFSTILALPMEIMSREEVGIASGLVFAIGYSGGIIGPLIGGRILDLTGNLGQSLIMLIGVSIAAAVLASRLPETGPKGNSKREQSLSTG